VGWTRFIIVVTILSLATAGVVALASRTPARIRNAAPPESARDPALGASFTDEQVARHGAYQAPSYLSFVLSTILTAVVLVLLMRGPFAHVVDRVQEVRGGWLIHALLLGVFVSLLLTVVMLPLGFVRGFANARAWGLSTQDLGGWLSDQVRGAIVGALVAAVSAGAFFGVVRSQPRLWWLTGWAAFTALSALLVFLYPVAIAPLFNRFTPLEDEALRQRVLALADEAGVNVKEVLVADASKRTTAENAYVAGLGPTKNLVLYDTLLAAGSEDETAFVVAHELGHKAENHVVKLLALSSLGLLAAFGALYVFARSDKVLTWSGATSIADPRILPLLLLFALLAALVAAPIQSTVSRTFERQADAIAIRLTDDPRTAVAAFRRLAFSNLADLRPPAPVVWALFSHPPIPDRIRAAMAGSATAP